MHDIFSMLAERPAIDGNDFNRSDSSIPTHELVDAAMVALVEAQVQDNQHATDSAMGMLRSMVCELVGPDRLHRQVDGWLGFTDEARAAIQRELASIGATNTWEAYEALRLSLISGDRKPESH